MLVGGQSLLADLLPTNRQPPFHIVAAPGTSCQHGLSLLRKPMLSVPVCVIFCFTRCLKEAATMATGRLLMVLRVPYRHEGNVDSSANQLVEYGNLELTRNKPR